MDGENLAERRNEKQSVSAVAGDGIIKAGQSKTAEAQRISVLSASVVF
jgi:hypothetical protein